MAESTKGAVRGPRRGARELGRMGAKDLVGGLAGSSSELGNTAEPLPGSAQGKGRACDPQLRNERGREQELSTLAPIQFRGRGEIRLNGHAEALCGGVRLACTLG